MCILQYLCNIYCVCLLNFWSVMSFKSNVSSSGLYVISESGIIKIPTIMLLRLIYAFTYVSVYFMKWGVLVFQNLVSSSWTLHSWSYLLCLLWMILVWSLPYSISIIYLYSLQIHSGFFIFFHVIEYSFWIVYLEFYLVHSDWNTMLLSC